jgi:transposase
MLTVTLSDEQWQKILPFLRSHPNAYVGREQDCRQFLEAVLWITRSGAQWRSCLRSTATGTLSINDSRVGAGKASSSTFISLSPGTPIWNI